jgi:hypothetical protein
LETLDTEGLITIQVAQLEKEKKELSERLRIISKRIDHIERAYRKDERPLLAEDYAIQQKTDRETFDAIQKARLRTAREAHEEDLATKARLSRMLGDYHARRETIILKKGEEFAKKKEQAARRIHEEKEKRKKAVMKQREEERVKREKEEEAVRQREAEEARIAAGMFSFLSFVLFCSDKDGRTSCRGRSTQSGRGSRSCCGCRSQAQGRSRADCSPGGTRERTSRSQRKGAFATTTRGRGFGAQRSTCSRETCCFTQTGGCAHRCSRARSRRCCWEGG